MAETFHVLPTAELATRVLLPGDPGRALRLAQSLLTEPKMFNHNRGLWGYTGPAADGALLTIQSTGMGGPSAAIVISELVALGAERLVRVGTCGALDGALALGELIVAGECIAADGTSRALGAGERVRGDGALTAALAGAAGRSGTVVSTDLFYDDGRREAAWVAAGAIAVEMETATLFALGARLGVATASVLAVSDLVLPARLRIGAEALERAEERLGAAAASVL
jgi:uridine phosphorylase